MSTRLLLVAEWAGLSLSGAIDGSNRIYQTSYDWTDSSLVSVYVNGQRKRADWDDGFILHPPRTVELRLPLLPATTPHAQDGGDTLEIEYTIVAGAQFGGVPDLVILRTLVPDLRVEELVPALQAQELVPDLRATQYKPILTAGEIKPRLVIVGDPDGCH